MSLSALDAGQEEEEEEEEDDDDEVVMDLNPLGEAEDKDDDDSEEAADDDAEAGAADAVSYEHRCARRGLPSGCCSLCL